VYTTRTARRPRLPPSGPGLPRPGGELRLRRGYRAMARQAGTDVTSFRVRSMATARW